MNDLHGDPGIALGGPAIYRIRVRDRLNARAGEYIRDVQIEKLDAHDAMLNQTEERS